MSFQGDLSNNKIINMHEQARQEAYRLLPAPLPIQKGDPHSTTSLLSFVETPYQQPLLLSKQPEQLCPVSERLINRKNVHQIGENLSSLFASPVYKCHEGLDMSNNQKFCSWFTDQNYRINVPHSSYELAEGGLVFESRFESGNLGLAAMAEGNPRAYYLALQRDVNSSSGTTQWFYFRANAGSNAGSFTFHIVNYVKPFSMFRVGMKPCVYSSNKGHWERAGTNIDYRRNSLPFSQTETYYTLSFTYEFEAGEGDVYFAYCYPYTYSRLQRFLEVSQMKNVDRMRRKVITKTLGGNVVEQISITNPQVLNKRTLYMTARTHPGETVSSFVCEAIIEFLLSNNPEAQKLRDQFIIKIVPMLNPDGVVNGSYRCSLAGVDLNRQWKNPNKTLHPQIYSIKKLILESQYKKLLFVDIHGHSKKKASFMYGCVSARSPYTAKELPYILSRRMAHFSYFSCNFATPRSKQGTSRITLWRAGIEHSYTYEVSFCGPQKERRHFSLADFAAIGHDLCRGLSGYFYSRILQLEMDEELNRHCEQFYNDEELMNVGNEETNGSSSELEDEHPQDEPVPTKSKTFRRTVRANATEKTETGRLNDLLDQYMRKQAKQREVDEVVDLQKQQRNAEKDVYLRQRQSFMATRVNIQQIQPDSPPNLSSSYYGFAVDKHLDQRSSSLRNSAELALQHSQRRERAGESFGILLPNVQKNQYKRYQRPERYRKEKNLGDRSVSLYVQNLLQGNPSPYQVRLSREISLGDRIRSRISDKF